MTAVLLGSLLLAVVAAGLLPWVAWLERRTASPSPGDELRPSATLLEQLLAPLPLARAALAEPDPLGPGTAPVGARVAPVLRFLSALAVLALIPFGARYDIVAEPVTLALADPEHGLLLALLAAAVAALAAAWTGISGARTSSRVGAVRSAGQSVAALVALMASLLPMLVLYGSLRPSEIAAWQDATIPLAELVHPVAPGAARALPAFVALPAWGLLLNAPAALLVLLSASALLGMRPCDAPTDAALDRGLAGELAGARRLLDRAADHLWTLALAALLVLLFLGGPALPWLPQPVLVGWIEPFFGRGFGELVCAGAHLACFLVKLVLTTGALVALRARCQPLVDLRVRTLCLARIVPLALLDAFVTLAVLATLGEGAA